MITNYLDHHYGDARNWGLTHSEAEEYARIACDTGYNPRHVPVIEKQGHIAASYLYLSLCAQENGPCLQCILDWMDVIDADFELNHPFSFLPCPPDEDDGLFEMHLNSLYPVTFH
jgi:hypothetical protein